MRSVAQQGTQTRTKSVVAPSETLAAWKLLCLSDCGLGTSTCFFLVPIFSLVACALFRPARTRADRRTFRRSCFFFFFLVYLLLLRAFLSLPCLLFCFRRYAPPLLLVISSQPDRLPLLPRVVPVCPMSLVVSSAFPLSVSSRVQVGDREFTLDDCWSLELNTRVAWKRVQEVSVFFVVALKS